MPDTRIAEVCYCGTDKVRLKRTMADGTAVASCPHCDTPCEVKDCPKCKTIPPSYYARPKPAGGASGPSIWS